jgi:transposase
VGEVLDINRFETGKAFVAFAGIDPAVHQSGQFDGQQMHMSKRGSPHLRRALWLVACNAYRDDPDMQAFYARKKAEGKHHNTIIGAIARKMAGRIYAVWKGNQPYRSAGPTEAGTLDANEAHAQ